MEDAVKNIQGLVFDRVGDERRRRAHPAGNVGRAENAAGVRGAGNHGDQLAVDLVAGAFAEAM